MSHSSRPSVDQRLRAVCEQINNDKDWHEANGNRWHLDAGKLESLLIDCELGVVDALDMPQQ